MIKDKIKFNLDYVIGFLIVLTVILIGLQLLNFIAWSWLFVLLPLWIIPAIALIIAGFVGWATMIAGIFGILISISKK